MLNEKNKKLLINIGILSGTFLAVTAILILMIFGSRSFWNEGLKDVVVTTIEKNQPKTWSVGNAVQFKSPLNTSAAVFACKEIRTGRKGHAVIIKIASLCGPVPAVFICCDSEVIFAGYGIENGKADKILSENSNNGSILYWQTELVRILEKAGIAND